jgi:predicted permease
MSLWRQLTRGLRVLTRRTAADREVDDELQHYQDEATAASIARGLSPADARRAARVEVGSVTAARDEIRAGGWEHLVDTFMADLRHALRVLRRSPAFTAITVLMLALGIGANAAIFSIVNGVLLAPLPYPQAERLVSLLHTAPGINIPTLNMAPALYFTYREDARTFADISLWKSVTSVVTGGGEPEEVPTLLVTHRFLPMLGVQPALGRSLSEEDERPNGPRTVMLAHGYWLSRFGGDPAVVGRRLTIGGEVYDVIGVLPASFEFGDRPHALVLPILLDRARVQLVNFAFNGLGRLAPGATLADARADIARMIPLAPARFPVNPGFRPTIFADARMAPALVPMKDDMVGDIGRTLWLLMATVSVVLLIACANVANLLLVRADARHHELAVRAALGAGWGRLARTLLLEGLVLGLMGGALGLAVASIAVRALITWTTAFGVSSVPRLHSVSLDWRVLAFTLAVSLGTGLLFGLIPVLRYGRPQLLAALRGEGRGLSQSRERQRARSLLVVIQVALAVLLLVGVALMTRTFVALRQVDPGFSNASTLQALRIGISTRDAADPTRVLALQEALLQQIAALPGVTAVAVTSTEPMAGGPNDLIYAEDHPPAAGTIPPVRRQRFMSPGFVSTIGSRVVAGRDFTWDETRAARPVALVSENLAREWWGTPQAAIGKRIRAAQSNAWSDIIGVVADLRDDGLTQKAPAIAYWPMLQSVDASGRPGASGGQGAGGGPGDGARPVANGGPGAGSRPGASGGPGAGGTTTKTTSAPDLVAQRSIALVVRTPRAGSASLIDELRRAVWSINPNLPLTDVMTTETRYERALSRHSLSLVLLAIAGTKALLLAVIGLYGVIAYAVSRRTREIGIRLALGAPQLDVTALFVRHGLRLSLYGIGCGLVASFLLTGLLRPLLFDVRPADPLAYIAATSVLLMASLLASYLPARRASRLDPVESLRAE